MSPNVTAASALLAALTLLAGCTDDGVSSSAGNSAAPPPSRSATASSPVPTLTSAAPRPTHLPRIDHDVFGRTGDGDATFTVVLDRPVEMMVACTGGSRVELSTRPSVTGLGATCGEHPASRFLEQLRLSTYPQRVVFVVRSPQQVRWRLGLDSQLIRVMR